MFGAAAQSLALIERVKRVKQEAENRVRGADPPPKMKKNRADVELMRRNLVESREKAQSLILAGVVRSGVLRIDKPSVLVAQDAPLSVEEALPYVSRGGLKLSKAMDEFQVDAKGIIALDVGSSTGGFTDVLLQRGADRVYAVDVGYGQLDARLRSDPRVVVMERTNARFLIPERFDPRPSFCVMDVSFISIRLLLPVIFPIVGTNGRIVTLVKPQFEAGRLHVGKGGVVRDSAVRERVMREIAAFVGETGWSVRGVAVSPIQGPAGNIEFLFDIIYGSVDNVSVDAMIADAARTANEMFKVKPTAHG
jgi:23S rRNA (cytidine1920-2'-O)/16S rRNA (cytidine1409-2'-O)-methyltransferase